MRPNNAAAMLDRYIVKVYYLREAAPPHAPKRNSGLTRSATLQTPTLVAAPP